LRAARQAGVERLLAADLRRGGLLWQKHCLDVWQDTALRDRHARQQLVELLVVADRQLEVTRDDARLLVVTSGIAGQLEHLGGEILHDGGEVDGCACTNSLGVVALAQQTVDSANRELKSGAARSALRLSLNFASFTAARHVVVA